VPHPTAPPSARARAGLSARPGGGQDATDAATAEKWLAVSLGAVPYDCRQPSGHVSCEDIDRSETFATGCRIAVLPAAGTNDAATACGSWAPPAPVPEIQCVAPAGIGAGQDLIIYWHGIATVLSNW